MMRTASTERLRGASEQSLVLRSHPVIISDGRHRDSLLPGLLPWLPAAWSSLTHEYEGWVPA